jgi:KDO2-lipid IV(A) lauroyltransferase
MKACYRQARARHRLEFRLFSTISFLVSLLPRKTMVKVGRSLGTIGYLLWKARRRIALSNLQYAFGETKTWREKKWIARESFKNTGASVLELAWGICRMNETVFRQAVEVEGLPVIRSAMNRKRGAIILPAHYGNWEIMANAVGYLKIHAHFVAKRLKNPYLDKAINDYRCETGNRVIYTNGASRKMEAVLKKGGVIATLLDQKVPVHEGGILVDFFGRMAPTTPLLAELHLATGAPLVLATCYPLRDGRCRMVFGPEIRFVPSGDHSKDVHDLTQACIAAIEAYIREKPQFWIWGHKRWKLD